MKSTIGSRNRGIFLILLLSCLFASVLLANPYADAPENLSVSDTAISQGPDGSSLDETATRTVSSRVPTVTYEEVCAKLTPEQKKQFDLLIQMTVAMPAFLAQKSGTPGFGMVNRNVLTPGEQEALKGMLRDGTLLRKSCDGKTILSHLAGLACEPQADSESTMSGKILVRDLIRLLQPTDLNKLMKRADNMEYLTNSEGQSKQKGVSIPGGLGEITQCKTHYTCGAAAMEVWLRLNRPEELVRIAYELVCKGKAEVREDTMKPARGSLQFHAGDTIYTWRNKKAGVEDRSDIDILLQSSIMDKVSLGNWSYYDVAKDSGDFPNIVRGNSGAHPMYMKRHMEKVTGHPFAYAHNLNVYGLGKASRFFGNLSARTPQGDLVDLLKSRVSAGDSVMIAYQTRPSDAMALHYVTVTGYNTTTDTFYYADTDEAKSDRSKMYTKTSEDMMNVLRCVVYPQ